MKKIGIFMLVAGFLWASIMSVLDTRVITSWAGYVAAVLTASVGVALIRIHALRLTSAEGALAASLQALHQSMERAVANITKLNDEKADLYVYDIRHKIDELFPEDLMTFADSREALSHQYGLQAYADVMSIFAAGERYLNRVWSASADGYVDEVNNYLDRACEQFTATLGKLNDLKSGSRN